MSSVMWKMSARYGVVYVDDREVARNILEQAGPEQRPDPEMAVYLRGGKRVGWQFRFPVEAWNRMSEIIGVSILPAPARDSEKSSEGDPAAARPLLSPSLIKPAGSSRGKANTGNETRAASQKSGKEKDGHSGDSKPTEPVTTAARNTAARPASKKVPTSKTSAAASVSPVQPGGESKTGKPQGKTDNSSSIARTARSRQN